jgi:hypothetical protein
MSTRSWPSLHALGRRPLPESIEVGGAAYAYRLTFKNDFFAITALYEGPAGKVVLKANRQARLLGLPLSWIGRWLASREVAAYERLADLPGIPRLIGRWERTGLVHEYVEGHVLRKGERVPDDFHPSLAALIDEIHGREMAYVDLEKCENVLVGDDGQPYLFDFQICWNPDGRWPGRWGLTRWLRKRFQAGDRYHLVKLQRRTRPDQLSPEVLANSYRRPWYIKALRIITRPPQMVRRAFLAWIDPERRSAKRGGSERGRVDAAECTRVDAADPSQP